MPKAKERHLLEATLQNIEAAIDSVTSNEAVAAIPVISTAFKVCKGIDDIRSRAFAAKLERFVSEPSLQSAASKDAIARKVQASPDEAQKIGETMFLVLDRFIDLDKPQLLAKVFVAYLDNVISAIDLQRLAQAIDLAFAPDLKQLIDADEMLITGRALPGEGDHWKKLLLTSGLVASISQGLHAIKMTYEITPLGQTLWKACRHVART
jgi:hypothetical protein